jgi:hypothetical protein
MPTTETIELATALRDELQLPIGRVIVNGVLPALFSSPERETLEGMPLSAGTSPVDEILEAGRLRASRERIQACSLQRLNDALALPFAYLPFLFEDASLPSAIRELATRLA